MSEEFNKLIIQSIPNQEKSNELLGRLFDVARPTTVYSEPVTAGEYTLITASEVSVAMGAGYGGGGGFGQPPVTDPEKSATGVEEGGGAGGGGGGGGTAIARPVAAISIGPDGVRVEPIVDPTKIALAFFTTIGAIFMAAGRMRRKSRQG